MPLKISLQRSKVVQTLRLLRLHCYPIFEQLQLEEALLRADESNWCLINEGTPPAIVLGISGQIDKLVHEERFCKDPVPLVRRFSGGGTVFVDEQTLFITFICNAHHAPVLPNPENILHWSAELYKEILHGTSFRLRENDYAMEDKKCGGNAQYFRKERWLHHSSWLWDFSLDKMDYLLHPPRVPCYRQGRSHEEFLCRLKEHFSSKELFVSRTLGALCKRFVLEERSLEECLPIKALPHRKTTELLKGYGKEEKVAEESLIQKICEKSC
jgi:lipoate-protein ligase A